MRPDLNKLKYLKLHRKKRIIKVNKGRKGSKLSNYNIGMYSKKEHLITFNQMEAVRKLINQKLKGKSNKNKKNLKIIKSQVKVKTKKKKTVNNFNLRYNFCLGLTEKPLQVRMGKGKGNPVEWVYPCAKNRVLIEFSDSKIKFKKIKKILLKAGSKLPVAIKINKINKKNNYIMLKKIKCIKEL